MILCRAAGWTPLWPFLRTLLVSVLPTVGWDWDTKVKSGEVLIHMEDRTQRHLENKRIKNNGIRLHLLEALGRPCYQVHSFNKHFLVPYYLGPIMPDRMQKRQGKKSIGELQSLETSGSLGQTRNSSQNKMWKSNGNRNWGVYRQDLGRKRMAPWLPPTQSWGRVQQRLNHRA